ncbi:substrate-binding domain-containing protein [Kitasatospora sp. NPDC057692]|uniref:substrate-binding domain-containing protein n=1 Tax=Kitasatospora sp. NPDC057692 TaxID=3346215 RepID=UPI0036781C60
MLRLAARAASALTLASALALTATTPALADPLSQPTATDVVGTGSATTEQLYNRLSTDYNASLAAAGDTVSPRLYSWDATGASPITPKAGAAAISRPYGPNSGITALTAYPDTVDFARSNRGPQPEDPVTDTFVALAKDAVAWAAPVGGNAPVNLSASELRLIYSCLHTNWRQISPSLPDAEIRPVLPRFPSETRRAFLQMLDSLEGPGPFPTPGPCVTTGEQENQGTDALLHDPNAIVPYSVGHYIGQVYGGLGRPGDEPGLLTPRAMNGMASLDPAAAVVPAAYSASFGFVLYTVVREVDWISPGARGQALRNIFGRTGWVCRSPDAQYAIRIHGFRPLPATACGSTTHS